MFLFSMAFTFIYPYDVNVYSFYNIYKKIFFSMAGKSLEQAMRDIQSRMAEERNRQNALDRSVMEQREIARKDYLERMRMFEASTSPSSAAAGAGAGGSGNRTTVYPTVFGQSYMIYWIDAETGIWMIRVYNYDDGEFSATINTGLSGFDWYIYSEWYAVSEAGMTLIFQSNIDSTYRIFFMNAKGVLVGQKSLDTNEDFQYTENASTFLGLLNEVSTAHHFDGHNVWTHTFPDVSIGSVEVDDGSEDDCTMDGSMIIEAANNERYFIARPDGSLVEVTDYLLDTGYRLDHSTDFIAANKNDYSLLNIVSQEGTLINSYDLTSFPITSLDNNIDNGNGGISLYGDNSVWWKYDCEGYSLVVTYNGNTNQFVSMTHSYADSTLVGYNESSWINPVPSFGKDFILADYTYILGGEIGFVVTDLKVHWLPYGASSFRTQDLSGLGTMSFIEGFGQYTGNREFSKGENPIFMYGVEGGDIQVGFLRPEGFATASTGIGLTACTNIWGQNIADKSYAVFDIDGSRVWQIYGTNSILDNTTTGTNWTYGEGGRSANRYGTLAVVDSGNPLNNFVYTSTIGLVQGPTGDGFVFNNNRHANRTGISYPEQVITQFVPGQEGSQYVWGFHVLREEGVSEFVEFPGGTSSTNVNEFTNDIEVGDDIIYIRLYDGVSDSIVLVYDKATLELIHQMTTTNELIEVYKDRVLIHGAVGTELQITLIGKNGVDTMVVQQTDYGVESNDTNDND